MPSLRIPSRYHGAIKQMAQLSPDELSCIQEFIRNAEYPYKVDPSNKTTDPAKQIIETYSPVLEFITSLFYLIQVGSSRKAEEVGEGIKDYLQGSDILGKGNDDTILRLSDYISSVLNMASPARSFVKASIVRIDYERVFQSSRIFTDVRPIFNAIDSLPAAIAISHNLKLTYNRNNEQEEFFVALDDADLEQLIESLNRARAKSKLLKDWYISSSIKVLD
jgi:hypothetical protein